MKGLGKYTIPIIGVLSSGKSTFINGLLLNKTILEVGMAHTTKFICILRHQPELPDGKYRFTKVKIDSNSLIKDGDSIEDEDAIKKKIIEINTKEVVSEDIFNDFYLFELNIHLIDDKKANDELLKDIDFMDIPGLDFFEAQKNDKKEMETKKIANLFKNFKDKLRYFIIVFDCLRLQHDTGFTILEQLKNEFNIEMENNLIVINKVNLMPEKTIDEIKEYFVLELLKKPDIINHNKNVVLPLNAEKILLQQQYKINFNLFIKYLYYLFCEYTLENKNLDNCFYDYIDNFINKKKEELKIADIDISNIYNYEEEIKPAFKQIYSNNYHTEQIKNVKEEKEEDFLNDINKDIFCELYYLYSNNLIKYDLKEYEKAKEEIINYLKMIENNKDDKKDDKKEKAKDNIKEKKNDNFLFIKKFDEFMNLNIIESGNNMNLKVLNEINKRKNLIVNAFLNTQFRISVVGLSSVGKSYIINCLIGKEILETGSGETTKFGLIIENHDSDEVNLCRAKYKYIEDEKGKKYLIFEKDDNSFVSGFDNVKNHLLLLNRNSITQEKNKIQDNEFIFSFWILKIRIAMCQFKNFKIQIIDFPGLGTSLKFIETEIFKNLLSTSNIIFHVLDFNKTGEEDRKISNSINKDVNEFRLDPYFANENTLYLLNKLNPSTQEDNSKYKDKISEIFGYKKETISLIGINNKFYDDMIEVTNSNFSNYLKKYYDNYNKRYKKKYSDFVIFFNSLKKIKDNEEKILKIDNINEQIIKDKAMEEFQYFLSKNDKNEYEKIIFDYINKNENFKNNILYFYTNEKITLDKNGILKKIDDLNNFIILRFGYYRNYFSKIIEGFILNINELLQNILNSRSIPKEDLDAIKNKFKKEIEDKYKTLIVWYSENYDNLIKKVKAKFDELKKNSYKSYLAIDKSKIRDDIQKFSEGVVNEYNKSNKDHFTLIIQNQLFESLKNIIFTYEEKRNNNQKGKKMEFNEFKKFIKNNIKIIENTSIDLENVETENDECCGYSEEKKNEYLANKYENEKSKLQKYFDILIQNTEKQKNDYITKYLAELSTSFGKYNQEEKKNINSIKTQLDKIINDIYHGISDYHLYVEESAKNSNNIFKNEIEKVKVASDEGFGFKKLDIFIYPGKNINLRGISIKIKKEDKPEYSTPFISISFPSKNIHLFEKITSYLLDFEKSQNEKIFIIGKEKNVERIMMKINFVKNFKYFNWIEKFSDVFSKFSLFKFEFLTPIMFNQPLDTKAAYDILKSFLLIQIQGDIPVISIFEFLRVEKIVTKIITQLIPDYMRVLLNALTSITFELNSSVEEIPFESFVKSEMLKNGVLNKSFMELIIALLGIPNAFIDSEDVEINFRLFKNNLKILLNLPVQHSNLLKNN